MKKKAFTLVELIVVITILSILSTIAFISFQGYSQSSRDSVRLSDVFNMNKALSVSIIKEWKVPAPENSFDITANGILINYQWIAGAKVLGSISVHNGWIDPLENSYYTYVTNKNFSKYQLLYYLENWSDIAFNHNNVNADFIDKFPKLKGADLGVLIDPTSNAPITATDTLTEVDIINTNIRYAAYFNNNTVVTWTGQKLKSINYVANYSWKESCKQLLENYPELINQDGIYKLAPAGHENLYVYCDMTNQWWGWTLLLMNRENIEAVTFESRLDHSSITYPNYNAWNNIPYNDNTNLSSNINVVSKAIESVKFKEIKFECIGEECSSVDNSSIYSHDTTSLLKNKTGNMTKISDHGWPFKKYRMYKSWWDNSISNVVPYDTISIDPQCAPTSNRPYEACVQIGIVGLDYYSFQNAVGIGLYGKESYDEILEIQSPFWEMTHRSYTNLKANIWIR